MTPAAAPSLEHVDVLIVGAGLSGIGAAHTISTEFPGRTYAILEARDTIGGTWDLFRYPGVRSDSDMHTLGYRFRPWSKDRAIADGDAILDYVKETARLDGTDRAIRYHSKVVGAAWSTPDARWTVDVEDTRTGDVAQLTASFLFLCPGYYDYDEGYTPEFPGIADFRGQVVHPQFWPEDLAYQDKQVVIIGSGATAVTLVPAMADRGAGHVTMLQRSPTYIAALPGEDPIAKGLRKVLPKKVVFPIVRWKNILLFILNYQLAKKRPAVVKAFLRKDQQRRLPAGFDIDKHLTPTYDPWDQRLCVVPDGDLFRTISQGKAEIVTDHIETFTPDGIRLQSGRELPADIVITATGLQLKLLGGMSFTVDGEPYDPAKGLSYRATMLTGLPNMVFVVGYTNASWTLKADLVGEYATRLLKHMDEHGYTKVVVEDDPTVNRLPLLDFKSGYVLRAMDRFPKSGDRAPWALKQNYALDMIPLRFQKVDDGVVRFSRPTAAPVAAAPEKVTTAS